MVNVVINAPENADEVAGALIDTPESKRINAVGWIIAKRAAEHLKPVLPELGHNR